VQESYVENDSIHSLQTIFRGGHRVNTVTTIEITPHEVFERGYVKETATTVLQQTLGLMFRKPGKYCMEFIFPKQQRFLVVHTFFMHFPLNFTFYDRSGNVVRSERVVKPWRVLLCKNVKKFVEWTAN
jgi:uncharacterized membrane protein (UPF0127 family)